MKVLVTGAAGFIGSNLCERLLAQGERVVGIDNFDPYYAPEIKRFNLQRIGQAPEAQHFKFQQLDIRDADKLTELFASERFDAVAHLAALAGVRYSEERAHLYTEVNVVGTLNMLEAARAQQLPGPFVFASTSSVYGASTQIPFNETEACDRPLAPYPATKRAGELFGHTYHHLHRLNFTALRFFTVYGPGNRPDMMAHLLLDHLLQGKPIRLYNRGEMWRDWTYVDDITAGIAKALATPLGYAVLNIGRGQPVLLRDFVARLEQLTGRIAQPEQAPMPGSDMRQTFASIDRAQQMIGYEPLTSIEEGTAALHQWYMAQRLRAPSIKD